MTEKKNLLPLTEARGTPGEGLADEADIRRLVVTFYDVARGDGLLGPIFDAKIGDWDAHYDTMCDFWSSAVLKTGRYSGRPASAHFGLGLTEAHFERWLSLWERVARQELGDPKAEPFVDMGRRMARAMMNVSGMLN
ncbi:MAG TPA: group III truncated hemoglobin [Phycisphaerales bacterium]|nr:group III truncated hemoglobin [Phycisphaerales bacterium]